MNTIFIVWFIGIATGLFMDTESPEEVAACDTCAQRLTNIVDRCTCQCRSAAEK